MEGDEGIVPGDTTMGILPVGSPAAILIWGWAPIAGLIYGLRPREVTA